MPRGEFQGPVAAANRFFVAAETAEGIGPVVPGCHVLRLELDDPVGTADGLFVAPEVVEGVRLVVPGENVPRVKIECLPVTGNRHLFPAQGAEGRALVVPGRCELRGNFQGLVMAAERFRIAPEAMQDDPLTAPARFVPRSEFDGTVEATERLLEAAQALQAHGFVIPFPDLGHLQFGKPDRLAGLTLEQRFEVCAQLLEALVSLARVLLHAAPDGGKQGRIELRHRTLRVQALHLAPVLSDRGRCGQPGGPRSLVTGHRGQEGKPATARNLVQHHAERIDVAPLVAGGGVYELLRGHVRRCAESDPIRAWARKADRSLPDAKRGSGSTPGNAGYRGEAEVGDSHRLVLADHDVGGLDVPVAVDSLRVSVFHSVAELNRPAQALGQGRRLLTQVSLQRIQPAFVGCHVLHADEQLAGDVDDEVGAHKIRMAPRRDPRTRLIAEALPRLGVGEVLLPEGLQDIDFSGLVREYEIGYAEPACVDNVIDLVLLADDVASLVDDDRDGIPHIGILRDARTQRIATQAPTFHTKSHATVCRQGETRRGRAATQARGWTDRQFRVEIYMRQRGRPFRSLREATGGQRDAGEEARGCSVPDCRSVRRGRPAESGGADSRPDGGIPRLHSGLWAVGMRQAQAGRLRRRPAMAQRPVSSRAARTSGRPATRILRWTAATS